MGYLAYIFAVLGFACIFCKWKWLLTFRRYFMVTMFLAGSTLGFLYWLPRNRELTGYMSIYALVSLGLFIFVLATRKTRAPYKVNIPADSYDIIVADRNAPTIQLSYFLHYQGKVYGISSFPPAGRPALTLYVKPHPKFQWLPADITIDSENTPISPAFIFGRIYSLIVLMFALLLPIPLADARYNITAEHFLSAWGMIILGYVDIIVLKHKRGIFYRIGYYFSWFLSIAGWLGMFWHIFLDLL